MKKRASTHHSKLGQFFSTAICGNDILSSALYVSGIAILFAGTYAPIALLAVGIVLLFYRTVYREVVEALPMNGGAYNALLNSASKSFAAIAGVMTILSYIATAVISAKTAVEYLSIFIVRFAGMYGVPITESLMKPWIIPSVIVILFGFALLVASGVSESAKTAASIFVFNIVTLAGFILIGLIAYLINGHAIGAANAVETYAIVSKNQGLIPTLFLAFSASLLGVSGFESSANFVEEQKPGVFRKTLRNMTIGVMVFNPLIAFVLIKVMPIAEIGIAKDFVLAEAAMRIGGIAMLGWIAINAFFVLCGAVLTSFVGVSGLMYRMTIDDCLPRVLLSKGTSQKRIIFTFFALCTSILLVTHGELLSLAGVYTISFLSVMTLFAMGNLILRKNRPDLKRPYIAPLPIVLFAALSTAAGIAGNILLDNRNVLFFLTYFIPAVLLTISVIYKRDAYAFAKKIFWWIPPMHRFFESRYRAALADHVYAFVHSRSNLARILGYIHKNENAHHVTLLHCQATGHSQADELHRLTRSIQTAGFYPELEIHVMNLEDEFGPRVINSFSKKYNVDKNKVFIGQIHEHHSFAYEELGGVRIIL